MKLISDMPTEGRFVAVWKSHEGDMYSDLHKWEGDTFYRWDDESARFVEDNSHIYFYPRNPKTRYVIDE